ncbi:ABC transporter permease [uncultured Dokdonia sp.]|uniref:ABC transporter permease n=1 Tax=uncultured Dokdonia sp. TaxID=575653 RepID=UPI002602D12C|nr:ABC transporter permease [uncultured Dokdonia sp.]
MFNKDRWNEILEALNANRFRTLLTAFGVFWGILILVLLLALTNGLKTGVSAGFNNFATNSMFMWSQGTSKPYKGLPKGRFFRFKLEDVQVLKDRVPELKYVSPRNQLGGFRGSNNVTRNEKTGAYNVYGDYPEFIKQQPMDITAGRFISYSDIEDKRKVAVIGVDVVKGLYDIGEDPMGTYIKINDINFLVIGTFKNPKSNGDQEEEANTIFVPFTTFSQAFNRADNVGWMAITAHDDTVITDVKEEVFAIMREQRTIHPDDIRAIGHADLAKEFGQIQGLFSILSFVSYFVGALILMSGVIGISNIMLIVVKERTKEIGIRRALGATPWEIRSQVMQESLVLTIVSGMAGIAVAAGLIWLMNFGISIAGPFDNFANPSVNIGVVLIALTILLVSGVLAGLIPATRATQMKPVDALRIE